MLKKKYIKNVTQVVDTISLYLVDCSQDKEGQLSRIINMVSYLQMVSTNTFFV